MSEAGIRITAEAIALGQRLARLAKEDNALDLTSDQAKELVRAVELLTGALADALDATFVTTRTATGVTQWSLGRDDLARGLRGVRTQACRTRVN